MNKIFTGFLILVIALCLTTPAFSDDPVSPQAAWNLINAGAEVVDVRTPEEFAAGHLAMAKNIDYEEILSHLKELNSDKSKPIVLYCGSGFRAGKAQKALQTAGYTSVVNAGGYDELQEVKLKQ